MRIVACPFQGIDRPPPIQLINHEDRLMSKRRSLGLEELGIAKPRPGIERLEDRALYASHLSATLNSGILQIAGAGAADKVVVQESQQLSVQGTTITVGKQSLASVWNAAGHLIENIA
jgi:hypothetical protein